MIDEKEILKLKKIGDNIRKERLKKNLSQANVAHEMKTSTKQFQRIENGELNTGVISIYKICKILNITIEKVLK